MITSITSPSATLTTAPATAAFARYYMIDSLQGKTAQEMPQWFTNWEKTGLILWLDDGDGRLRIVSEHCPFGGAPIEHPVICAVDRGLVRGMLGVLYGEAQTELSSSLPMGDDVCITDVTV